MLELEIKSATRLSTITHLLDALHDNNILYCHWKSNEHLEASMNGDTDLDVLFHPDQKAKLESLLRGLGFKRFAAIKQKQYKDIVDFIALDFESGKLIHLHTHYKLTLGEAYLKGYQPDFEDKILQSRVFDEQFGIYRIDPAFELVLLYIRESLKLRHRDILRMYLTEKIECNEYIVREYNWLKARSTDAEVCAILEILFREYAPIYRIIASGFSRVQLQELAPIIKKEFRGFRLYDPVTSLLVRWYREITIVLSRKLARFFGWPILSSRISPRGGLAVALIGADGSGKSTSIVNLKKTFQAKLDVFTIYFGRGDGQISGSRRRLHQLKKYVAPKEATSNNNNAERPQEQQGFWKAFYKATEALLVAREKNRNLNRMAVARSKGALVLCDRFPQNQIMGYNDGPLLHSMLSARNPILRALAYFESRTYEKAEIYSPDILFKLIAEAEVVEKRKPGETSIERLEAKINGIKRLTFNHCKVVTVDASKPLEEILQEIRKEIWKAL